jgi:hypothetical protein
MPAVARLRRPRTPAHSVEALSGVWSSADPRASARALACHRGGGVIGAVHAGVTMPRAGVGACEVSPSPRARHLRGVGASRKKGKRAGSPWMCSPGAGRGCRRWRWLVGSGGLVRGDVWRPRPRCRQGPSWYRGTSLDEGQFCGGNRCCTPAAARASLGHHTIAPCRTARHGLGRPRRDRRRRCVPGQIGPGARGTAQCDGLRCGLPAGSVSNSARSMASPSCIRDRSGAARRRNRRSAASESDAAVRNALSKSTTPSNAPLARSQLLTATRCPPHQVQARAGTSRCRTASGWRTICPRAWARESG